MWLVCEIGIVHDPKFQHSTAIIVKNLKDFVVINVELYYQGSKGVLVQELLLTDAKVELH